MLKATEDDSDEAAPKPAEAKVEAKPAEPNPRR